MSQQDFVSVIMPVFNGEAFMEEAIASVMNQTHSNWELIVVDDGSRDRSFEILEELASKEDRIVVLRNEGNRGISASRNRAIEVAKGEWIAFLDCDDQWEPSKLTKQLEVATKFRTGFVFTGVSYINREGEPYKGILRVPSKLTYKELRKHNILACSSVMARKEYFDEIKILRRDILDDYPLWLMILRSGITAYGVNEPLLKYRFHGSAVSSNKWKMLKKTYGGFRYIGLSPYQSIYFTSRHAMASSRKHFIIFTGLGRK